MAVAKLWNSGIMQITRSLAQLVGFFVAAGVAWVICASVIGDSP
jgi:hypothetical protein